MGWNMYVCGRVASLSLPTFAGEKDLYISVYVPVLVGIPYRFCSIQDFAASGLLDSVHIQSCFLFLKLGCKKRW